MHPNHQKIGSDPELWTAVEAEARRQSTQLSLIASENYASAAVLALQGSCLTNKYAEGYPGKRYYGGCTHVDEVEQLAIDRAKWLFQATYANVQPHCGSQANAAVYLALLEPGMTLLGMGLEAGGHLTHGSSVNFSGKYYRAVQYGLGADAIVDYEEVAQLARSHRPQLMIAGFSAYARHLDWAKLRQIADEVGAYLLVDMAHIAGLVAAGLIESPLPHAHVVTTTTHKTLAGPRGGLILSNHPDPQLHKKLDLAVFPGTQGGPLVHVIAAKAAAFAEAMRPEFVAYQKQVLTNAAQMARRLRTQHGYTIVGGTTENHLFLVDLSAQNVTGRAAEKRLGHANMIVNKNMIPNDPMSPFVTSGIRIGTPAITRRGMQEREAIQIADWLAEILSQPDAPALYAQIGKQVSELCAAFPIPGRVFQNF